MITLIDIYQEENRYDILYQLLSERTEEQAISHKQMPDYYDHVRFVDSIPYKNWYFIHAKSEKDYIGAVYLSKKNEIGIFIFNEYQGKCYGPMAVKALIDVSEGPFFANINPLNTSSKKMFEWLGFEHIQDTYRYG